jgi:thiol-disulfide isomerase/thioredoxin
MKFYLFLFSLLSVRSFSYSQKYEIALSRLTGSMPLVINRAIDTDESTSDQIIGLPKYLTDYKAYKIDFIGHELEENLLAKGISYPENLDGNIYAVCGYYNNKKIIIIDANNNKDFSDDKIFSFSYNRESLISRLPLPKEFGRDTFSGLDKYPGNELFINFNVSNMGQVYSKDVFVEINPGYNEIHDPTNPKKTVWLDYTFGLTSAECRKGDFEYDGKSYELFFQGFYSLGGLFFEHVFYYRRKPCYAHFYVSADKVNACIDEYARKPNIDGNIFDIELEPIYGRTATLTYIGKAESFKKPPTPVISGKNLLTQKFITHTFAGDKPTLVNFWGSWCEPCKKSFPDIVELNRKYQDKVNWFGVAWEQTVDERKLLSILNEHGITWPQLVDVGNKGITNDFYVNVFPTYILIGKDGLVILKTQNVKELSFFMKKME